jgi:hypothetical protein
MNRPDGIAILPVRARHRFVDQRDGGPLEGVAVGQVASRDQWNLQGPGVIRADVVQPHALRLVVRW